METLPAREERQFLENITAASQVRMSLTQLGIVIGAIAASAWWASTYLATKEDVKALKERSAAMSTSLREVTTTLAVLRDRSDRSLHQQSTAVGYSGDATQAPAASER